MAGYISCDFLDLSFTDVAGLFIQDARELPQGHRAKNQAVHVTHHVDGFTFRIHLLIIRVYLGPVL